MKNVLFGAAAAVLLILCPPAYRTLRAYADQAPALAWNLRTASWHVAETTANASTASANLAAASVSLKNTAEQLADDKTGAVAQVRAARNDVKNVADKGLTEIGDWRKTASLSLDNTLERVDGALYVARQAEADANQRLLDAIGNLNDRLTDGSKAVAALQAGISPILTNVGHITWRVDDMLPQFTECAYYDEFGEPAAANPDCLFNRYQGWSKSIEQITADFKKVADKFVAPRSWKAKLFDGVKVGAAVASKLPIIPETKIAVPRRIPLTLSAPAGTLQPQP